MQKQRILGYIFLLLSNMVCCLQVRAQEPKDSLVLPEQSPKEIAVNIGQNKPEEAPVFAGLAVMADLVGPVMKVTKSTYANLEAAVRLDFKEKFFPIFELGIGTSDKTGGDNNNRFKTTAPYFRIGMDYNINQKINGNRFFVGARYAYSSFSFDFTDPDYYDAVWKNHTPLEIKDQKSSLQWLELVVGVETKLLSIIRLGWNIRYRGRVRQSVQEMGEPWYVPGFGKNQSAGFGGTMNLAFDVGKSAKKQKK